MPDVWTFEFRLLLFCSLSILGIGLLFSVDDVVVVVVLVVFVVVVVFTLF